MCNNCDSDSTIPRHFLTRAERVEMLQAYKSDLESELKGVTEHIERLNRRIKESEASEN